MNKFKRLYDILLDLPSTSLTDALFILVDHMSEAGDGNISESFGNIGIDVTNTSILVCDIETGEDIAVFKLNTNV